MPTFELILTAAGLLLLPLALGFARIEGPGFWTENAHPAFIKDYLSRDRVLPGGAMLDPSGFSKADETVLTVDTGGAAGGATSIPLSAAIPTDDRGAQVRIPSGTLLDFGTEVVELAADAVTGDTALTVTALSTGVNAGDTATYAGDGPKFVPPGTPVGRTRTEAENNAGFGPVSVSGGSIDDDEVYLTVYPVSDALTNPEVELLRPNAGTVVVYSLLPGWADMPTAVQDWIHSNFTTTQAAD